MFGEYAKWWKVRTFKEKVTSVVVSIGFLVLVWALFNLCAVFNPVYGK